MGGVVALRGKAGKPQWQVPFGITCLALPLSRFSLPHALRCAPRPGRLSALSVTHSRSGRASEKDAKLAQKLGQLQPFIAAFPQECMGHHIAACRPCRTAPWGAGPLARWALYQHWHLFLEVSRV